MTPVVGLMVRPVGRPVAEYVSVSKSRSEALASSDTVSPSAALWSVMSVLKTGAWLVLVTVQVKLSVSVRCHR